MSAATGATTLNEGNKTMDQQRFDRLTRAMARGASRRAMLAGATAIAAGMLGRRAADATTAPD
ncbi:MAG TPA: hypothetical protein VFU81_23690, partial [Thermomicrobiales bacterium]|nr:hypothetical protein [Thermomicrobiales bacterium]